MCSVSGSGNLYSLGTGKGEVVTNISSRARCASNTVTKNTINGLTGTSVGFQEFYSVPSRRSDGSWGQCVLFLLLLSFLMTYQTATGWQR